MRPIRLEQQPISFIRKHPRWKRDLKAPRTITKTVETEVSYQQMAKEATRDASGIVARSLNESAPAGYVLNRVMSHRYTLTDNIQNHIVEAEYARKDRLNERLR